MHYQLEDIFPRVLMWEIIRERDDQLINFAYARFNEDTFDIFHGSDERSIVAYDSSIIKEIPIDILVQNYVNEHSDDSMVINYVKSVRYYRIKTNMEYQFILSELYEVGVETTLIFETPDYQLLSTLRIPSKEELSKEELQTKIELFLLGTGELN